MTGYPDNICHDYSRLPAPWRRLGRALCALSADTATSCAASVCLAGMRSLSKAQTPPLSWDLWFSRTPRGDRAKPEPLVTAVPGLLRPVGTSPGPSERGAGSWAVRDADVGPRETATHGAPACDVQPLHCSRGHLAWPWEGGAVPPASERRDVEAGDGCVTCANSAGRGRARAAWLPRPHAPLLCRPACVQGGAPDAGEPGAGGRDACHATAAPTTGGLRAG